MAGGCAYTRGAHESAEAPVRFPPPPAVRHRVEVVEIGIPGEDLDAYPQLEDGRVGFGLSAILVETLADSGHFDLLESEEAILERHRRLWRRTEAGFYAEDAPAPGTVPGDFLVSARVSYAETTRRGISLGPLTSQRETLRVSVNVCLEAPGGRDRMCREGRGEAEQHAGGAIFEYRGDRAAFQQSAAGIATRRAVEHAVYELIQALPPTG